MIVVNIVLSVILFAVMFLWSKIVHAVVALGYIPGLILIAAILGAAFWIEHRWPSPSPYPPGTPAQTLRRLIMAGRVDTAAMIFFIVMLFACLFMLPRDWLFYWMIPLAIAYVRWHVVSLRHERRLLAEDGVASPSEDAFPALPGLPADDGSRPPV
jgi:hypothetical protein